MHRAIARTCHPGLLAAITGLLVLATAAWGAEQEGRKLAFQTGKVTVGTNLATIDVPEGMRFLGPADARYLLETEWKNPPDPSVIGMVVAEASDKDGDPPVVVVSYSEDGHVSDDDAQKIDYDDLLKQMKESSKEASEAMVKQGYRSEELLGWAEPPHYDGTAKKLFWAKNLRFGGNKDETLNYCIRILGRKGVLELNAIGRTADLKEIGPVAQSVMKQSEFTSGNRYQDYQEGVDMKAAGGIAALVIGGVVLKKLGFLAIVGLGLLKFLKVLIIPLIFVGGWLMKVVKGRRSARAEREDAELAELKRKRSEDGRVPPPAS